MRGKVYPEHGDLVLGGITPAYAGKSGILVAGLAAHGDHPRVCGEKLFAQFISVLGGGSPPRMRGKGYVVLESFFLRGITPAYAGKRDGVPRLREKVWDHPRVCGEKTGRDLQFL